MAYSPLEASVAVQSVAYAATITVDPLAGHYVIVGTLTGNITIANPVTLNNENGSTTATTGWPVGTELTFDLTQDGTGSRTVTWGNKFLHSLYTASTGISYRDIVNFMWDGTNWVYQGSWDHVA